MKSWLLLLCFCMTLSCENAPTDNPSQNEPPFNILWITCEDINAFIGAYGDSLAHTPNLDKLAKEGVRFSHAFATAPVCSPSRSCLLTGLYATSLGTQHLRSKIKVPSQVKAYPLYLREAGFYCSNNGKEDYNFQPGDIWDDSSEDAHWRNRPQNKSFFSVFNLHETHQSQIFGSDESYAAKYGDQLPDSLKHEPDKIAVPPYHFDSPQVRKLWARYYDQVSIMDQRVGEILTQLEEDGLTEKTLIFFYSDHGTGMPRSKRALHDSGLRVPLIIKAPKALQEELALKAGTVNEELVHFVDFMPTLFSLLDIEIPGYLQGIPFLGKKKQIQKYVFGHSDRVDEAYEVSRTVRGKRFRYIRNYLPHLPLIQDNFYTDQSEIMKELRRLKEAGNLSEAQADMWRESRMPEELYDTERDPYETRNLATIPEYQEVLFEMREALWNWTLRTYDSGLLHEIDMNGLAGKKSIYENLQDADLYPLFDILGVTDQMMEHAVPPERLKKWLSDESVSIRYWATNLLRNPNPNILPDNWEETLTTLLEDPAPSVFLTAARILCEAGQCSDALGIILEELKSEDKIVRLYAARIFEELGNRASPIRGQVQALKDSLCPVDWSQYYELYSCWAMEEALKTLAQSH